MDDLIMDQEKLRIEMADLINKYKLPACMIEPVLKDYYTQICSIKEQQLQQAKQNIEMRENAKKEENNEKKEIL